MWFVPVFVDLTLRASSSRRMPRRAGIAECDSALPQSQSPPSQARKPCNAPKFHEELLQLGSATADFLEAIRVWGFWVRFGASGHLAPEAAYHGVLRSFTGD